jgi:cytochrome c-type biogenesis protein
MTTGAAETTERAEDGAGLTLELPVYGMTCSSCTASVTGALGGLEGVRRVQVDLDGHTVVVEGERGALDEAQVRRRIEELGYGLEPGHERVDRRPAWGALALGVAAAALVVLVGTVVFREVSASYFRPGRLAELNATFSEFSAASLALAFLFGLAVGFAPSSYAMAPAVVGYVTGKGASSRRRAAKLAGAFLAGLVLADVVLGAAFAAAGTAALRFFTARLPLWYAVAAVALVVLAVINLRLWQPRLPGLGTKVRQAEGAGGAGGAMLLGIPFGLMTCPSCTPLLLPVALGAAGSGRIWYGAALMGAFALGRGTPVAVLGASAGAFERMMRAGRVVRWVEIGVAILLLVAAGWFVGEFFRVGGFAGLVDAL